MTRVVFDIETDSLKPSKIWCLVAKNIDSGQLYTLGPEQIEQAWDTLEKSTYLVGHNILGYDIPVLERLTGRKVVSENTKEVDTSHSISVI